MLHVGLGAGLLSLQVGQRTLQILPLFGLGTGVLFLCGQKLPQLFAAIVLRAQPLAFGLAVGKGLGQCPGQLVRFRGRAFGGQRRGEGLLLPLLRKQLPLPGGVLLGGVVRGTGTAGFLHGLILFAAGGLPRVLGGLQVGFGDRLGRKGGRGRVVHCPAHRAGHPLVQVAGQKPGPAVIQAAAQPGGIGLGLLEGFLLFHVNFLRGVQGCGGGLLRLGSGLPVGKGVLGASQVLVALADLGQLQGGFLQFVQLAAGLAKCLFFGFRGRFRAFQADFGRFRLCFQRSKRFGSFLMLAVEGKLLLQKGQFFA